MNKLELGRELQCVREGRGYSRSELGNRMGSPASVVWKMEHGKFGWRLIERACRALDARVDVKISLL